MEWVDVDEWALDDWGSGLLEHWDGLELVRIAGFGGLFGWLVGGGEGWDGGCYDFRSSVGLQVVNGFIQYSKPSLLRS